MNNIVQKDSRKNNINYDINNVKNILSLIFSKKDILEVSEQIMIVECKMCKKNKKNFFSFNCGHKCCTYCTDELYDKNMSINKNVLFQCPFCRLDVEDVKYIS